MYRHRQNNHPFTNTYDTTLTTKKKVVETKSTIFESYILVVRFPIQLLLYDFVRGRSGGEINVPDEERCRSIVPVNSMTFIFGNREQNVVISCVEAHHVRQAFFTLYAVHVSRGEMVLVNFKNPILLKVDVEWKKTLIRGDLRFVLGKDILLIISYKEKLIDIFKFREVNGRYKREVGSMKPVRNNMQGFISKSGQGYALVLFKRYIVGVYEIFCQFPDCIIKRTNKEISKQVKPFLIIPLKVKLNILSLVGIHDYRNLVFLDAEPGIYQGKRKVFINTVRMYRESLRQDSV
jgi:hypothetical protein